MVDEFHTMPGADYEAILAELAKYGANLVLATQSLARLEALDRDQHRGLRATVFANLDGLFAFHTSAEDARYLVHELGGEVDEQDLVGSRRAPVLRQALQCRRAAAHLLGPPRSAARERRERGGSACHRLGGPLWSRSRGCGERPAVGSGEDRSEPASSTPAQGQAGQDGAGVARDAAATAADQPVQQPAPKDPRNEYRKRKARAPKPARSPSSTLLSRRLTRLRSPGVADAVGEARKAEEHQTEEGEDGS